MKRSPLYCIRLCYHKILHVNILVLYFSAVNRILSNIQTLICVPCFPFQKIVLPRESPLTRVISLCGEKQTSNSQFSTTKVYNVSFTHNQSNHLNCFNDTQNTITQNNRKKSSVCNLSWRF